MRYRTTFALAAAILVGSAGTAAAFDISSPQFKSGASLKMENVFNGFGCTGGNQSPALVWRKPPKGTQSFVLTMYDPDAPTGSGWWHWVVYNLPATTMSLPANATAATLPAGAVQGRTDFGSAGYGGPCPPPGPKHRYVFKVTALKVPKLDIPADASPALIGFMTNANALGSAKLTLKYGR